MITSWHFYSNFLSTRITILVDLKFKLAKFDIFITFSNNIIRLKMPIGLNLSFHGCKSFLVWYIYIYIKYFSKWYQWLWCDFWLKDTNIWNIPITLQVFAPKYWRQWQFWSPKHFERGLESSYGCLAFTPVSSFFINLINYNIERGGSLWPS